jgi:DNA-binding NarL/FixJ family response regulator
MEFASRISSRPRILIADDHALFAEMLAAFLDKTCQVVGIVLDGRAMVDAALRLRPDLITIEIGLPLLNGLDAARRVRKELPSAKLVFLTMAEDPNLAAAAMELGPVGYVLKQSGGAELKKAIDSVLRGQPYLTPRLRPANWREAKARAQQFSKEMTPRQRDVVQMLAEGRSVKEIAGLLDLSTSTVEFHKGHIKQVFHLRSNADVVLFALKRGLISLDSRPLR